MKELLGFLLLNSLSRIYCQTDLEQQCAALNGVGDISSTLYYRGSCIVRHATNTKFDEAKTKCNDVDITKYKGHLVHLLDQEITMTVIGGLGIVANSQHHIGMAQDKPGTEPAGTYHVGWHWLDGEGNLAWSADEHHEGRWTPGRPDNSDGNQDCAQMHFQSPVNLLNDIDCTDTDPYICQYHDNDVCFQTAVVGKRGASNSNSTMEVTTVTDVKMCAKRCIRTPVCQSMSFSQISGECRLHFYTEDDLELEADAAFNVYEKK